MKQTLEEAVNEIGGVHPDWGLLECFRKGFEEGAKWQLRQNTWHKFKDKRPKPNSHILRRMIHTDYQSYGKIIYYADFWGEDRPDKWDQDNDKVIYEWQYINE